MILGFAGLQAQIVCHSGTLLPFAERLHELMCVFSPKKINGKKCFRPVDERRLFPGAGDPREKPAGTPPHEGWVIDQTLSNCSEPYAFDVTESSSNRKAILTTLLALL